MPPLIDASAEFVRVGNKNKLDDGNREAILEALVKRIDKDHFAQLVENAEIAYNRYSLAVLPMWSPKTLGLILTSRL
jgi:type I restriction enzyme M protein